MGTFGEIVEPVSRSVWEDWDEIITENQSDRFVIIINIIFCFIITPISYKFKIINTLLRLKCRFILRWVAKPPF